MNAHRQEQFEQEIAHMAADFLAREAEVGSLITVTHAESTQNFKDVTIFLSILPASEEEAALKSAKRQRSDFHDYIRKHSKFHPTPTVDFEIDYGEKNRQRIDDLTRR